MVSSHKASPKWPLLLLSVIVIALWGETVTFELLIWDDESLIAGQPVVVQPTLTNLVRIWTEPHVSIYMPVTYTLWFLQALPARLLATEPARTANLVPMAAWVYHLVTVTLFLGIVLAAYQLFLKLVDKPLAAFLGALLLAAHPVQVESVAWVSENKGLLASLFSLWALSSYVAAARAETGTEPRKAFIWGTLFFALALLSKPWAVVVPALAAVIDWGFLRRPVGQIARSTAFWFALSIGMVLLTRAVQGPSIDLYLSWPERIQVAGDALLFYGQKLVVPWPLMPDHGRSPNAVLDVEMAWLDPLIAVLAISLGLILAAWLGGRRFFATGLLFLIALLPNLGFLAFAFQELSTVADRYLASALFAPSLFVALLVAEITSPLLMGLVVAAALGCGALVFQQVGVWADSDTLCRYAVKRNPSSAVFWSNLSSVSLDRGDYEQAQLQAERARELRDDMSQVYNNLAQAMARQGDIEGAVEILRPYLAKNPEDVLCQRLMVSFLYRIQRFEEAVSYARRLSEQLSSPADRSRLARMLVLSGQEESGLQIYHEVQERGPKSPDDEFLTAEILIQGGCHARAATKLRDLTQRFPRSLRAKARLAWVLATAPEENDRDSAEAVRLAKMVTQQGRSDSVIALETLAVAYANSGNFAEAIQLQQQILKILETEQDPAKVTAAKNRLSLFEANTPYRWEPPQIFSSDTR